MKSLYGNFFAPEAIKVQADKISVPFTTVNHNVPHMGIWECQTCFETHETFNEATQCKHPKVVQQKYPNGTYVTGYFTEKEGRAILGLGYVTRYNPKARTYSLTYLHDTSHNIYDVEEKYMDAKVALAKLFDFMGVEELP